jgi:hypothetical protein
MAPVITEMESLNKVIDDHAHSSVSPDFSAPSARLIVRRSETLKIKPPLVIRRFQDRVMGPGSPEDKISRDFYRRDFRELKPEKQSEVQSLHSKLSNPATPHPYLSKGLTFTEAWHLLTEGYAAENDKKYPQEIRAALSDFCRGLEKDIGEAAKAGEFFDEFSKADKALRAAVEARR